MQRIGSMSARWGGELAEGARCFLAAVLLLENPACLGAGFDQKSFDAGGHDLTLKARGDESPGGGGERRERSWGGRGDGSDEAEHEGGGDAVPDHDGASPVESSRDRMSWERAVKARLCTVETLLMR